MKIDEKFIPVGHPNRPGTMLESLKAIVIHYTANSDPRATDLANINYIGRKYVKKDGLFYEADGITKFRYGSAHVFIDCDSITNCIPVKEVAYAVGDRPNDYNNGFKGQTFIAKNIFNHRQNYQTISIEMCNNKEWDKVEENTIFFIRKFLMERNLKLIHNENGIIPTTLNKDEIYIFRHLDLTSKCCPAPYIKREDWNKFVGRILI